MQPRHSGEVLLGFGRRHPGPFVFLRRSLIAALMLLSVSADDCFFFGRVSDLDPQWPPPGLGDLSAELVATAMKERPVPVPDEAVPGETLPGDVERVQAREDEHAGIYFVEVVLGDVHMDAELPLLVLLHGRGDRPRIPGGPFAGLQEPVRVIVPRGPDRLGDGFTWLPVRTGEGKIGVLARSLREMAARLALLIDEVLAARATVGAPIIVGFSQGGLLTFTLAVQHPSVVGAAFPMAGWLPPPLQPTEREHPWYPRIRSMHGTADEIIPIEPTRLLVADLQALSIEIELVEFEGVGHNMSDDMNALFTEWLREAVGEQAPVDEPAPPASLDGGAGLLDGGASFDGSDLDGRRAQEAQEALEAPAGGPPDDPGRPAGHPATPVGPPLQAPE